MTLPPGTPWRDHPSPNHGPRAEGAAIDILLIHYTGMVDAGSALERLCDPATEVSAHYMIDEDGTVWRLVAEERRAWHAGCSFWNGESDINSRSIGIELVNPGHGPHYRTFPAAQMTALTVLAQGILGRHGIASHRVLGHSDVAPDRKLDPGELFDWWGLATAGVGIWPADLRPVPCDNDAFGCAMQRFGYRDASPAAIAAFQRHFRPAAVTGATDDETQAILAALIKQAGLE